VAASSGTAAVHLAISACGFEPGSEIITTPITDIGSVTPMLYEDLVPVFADIDPTTLNMDPASVADRVTDKTKAIVAVHLEGHPCDMDGIMNVAKKNDLVVIEDCAQAISALFKGKKVGTIGDIGCFSFMAIKHIITGGEGGMAITRDKQASEKMMISARNILTPGAKAPYDIPFRVLNYRMTEIQAAIGIEQLKKVGGILARRRRLYHELSRELRSIGTVKLMRAVEGSIPSPWFPFFDIDIHKLEVGLERYAEALTREGISCAAGYTKIPIYEYSLMKSPRRRGESPVRCPKAERALGRIIRLWGEGDLHESCTSREVEDIAQAFRKLERRFSTEKRLEKPQLIKQA